MEVSTVNSTATNKSITISNCYANNVNTNNSNKNNSMTVNHINLHNKLHLAPTKPTNDDVRKNNANSSSTIYEIELEVKELIRQLVVNIDIVHQFNNLPQEEVITPTTATTTITTISPTIMTKTTTMTTLTTEATLTTNIDESTDLQPDKYGQYSTQNELDQKSMALSPNETTGDLIIDSGSSSNDMQEIIKLEGIRCESSKIIVDHEDDLEEKTKDMVILRNLEITPPPPIKEAEQTKTNDGKRKEPATDHNESTETIGRSKRRRTQTKLFQVGETKPAEEPMIPIKSAKPSPRGRKKSTASSTSDANLSIAQDSVIQHTNDLQDVIYYEKNDYLAIRNEENSFYLCQLTENVRVRRPLIKVKWLDTDNNGKTYFLTSHYDKVPQKSIIMPVLLNKLKSEKKGEQLFTLEDQVRDNVMERLKRSLNAPPEASSCQELSTDD